MVKKTGWVIGACICRGHMYHKGSLAARAFLTSSVHWSVHHQVADLPFTEDQLSSVLWGFLLVLQATPPHNRGKALGVLHAEWSRARSFYDCHGEASTFGQCQVSTINHLEQDHNLFSVAESVTRLIKILWKRWVYLHKLHSTMAVLSYSQDSVWNFFSSSFAGCLIMIQPLGWWVTANV